MRPAYRSAGTIDAVHGSRGEVRFRPMDDAPNPLTRGQRVALVPPTLEDERRKTVAGIREDRGDVFVTFSDVGDRSAAELCVGRTVLVRADDLPEGWGHSSGSDLVGLDVCDATYGAVGRVVAVEEGPAQSRLVVDGPFGEVLIPAVEPILGAVADGVVRVECPEGLLGLAREGEGRAWTSRSSR